MLRFSVLGSGSGGNSAVICLEDGTTVLVDAGLSARQLCLRLESLEIDPDSLSAIVLTHEHGDHTSGLDVFLRKRPDIPVYATTHTCAVVDEKMKSRPRWQKFAAGSTFEIAGLAVETFSVPHDAVDPVGFVFRGQSTSLGLLSDVGHVTTLIKNRLRGVDSIFVEANYDDRMLQDDVKRPWATKQRISSRHGHLSNEQTCELLAEIAQSTAAEGRALHRVVLGHLSSDCNCPIVACDTIRDHLAKAGHTPVEIVAAQQRVALPMMPVAIARPEPPVFTEAIRVRETAVAATPDADAGWVQGEWGF